MFLKGHIHFHATSVRIYISFFFNSRFIILINLRFPYHPIIGPARRISKSEDLILRFQSRNIRSTLISLIFYFCMGWQSHSHSDIIVDEIKTQTGIEALKSKLVKKAKQEGAFDLSPENIPINHLEVSKNQSAALISRTRTILLMYINYINKVIKANYAAGPNFCDLWMPLERRFVQVKTFKIYMAAILFIWMSKFFHFRDKLPRLWVNIRAPHL